MNFTFHQSQGVSLQSIVNMASGDALKLMIDFMAWCPERRPTASNVKLLEISKTEKILKNLQSLKYKYFQVGQKLGAPILSQPTTSTIRKSSAGSTQSDSKLVVATKRALLGGPQASKLTQKVRAEIFLNKLFQQHSS